MRDAGRSVLEDREDGVIARRNGGRVLQDDRQLHAPPGGDLGRHARGVGIQPGGEDEGGARGDRDGTGILRDEDAMRDAGDRRGVELDVDGLGGRAGRSDGGDRGDERAPPPRDVADAHDRGQGAAVGWCVEREAPVASLAGREVHGGFVRAPVAVGELRLHVVHAVVDDAHQQRVLAVDAQIDGECGDRGCGA